MYVYGARSASQLGRLGRRRGLGGYRPNQAVRNVYTRRRSLGSYIRPGLGQDWSDDTFNPNPFVLTPDPSTYSFLPAAGSIDAGAGLPQVPQGAFLSTTDIVPGATAALQLPGMATPSSYTAPAGPGAIAQAVNSGAGLLTSIFSGKPNPTAPGVAARPGASPLGISSGTIVLLGVGILGIALLSGGGKR